MQYHPAYNVSILRSIISDSPVEHICEQLIMINIIYIISSHSPGCELNYLIFPDFFIFSQLAHMLNIYIYIYLNKLLSVLLGHLYRLRFFDTYIQLFLHFPFYECRNFLFHLVSSYFSTCNVSSPSNKSTTLISIQIMNFFHYYLKSLQQ